MGGACSEHTLLQYTQDGDHDCDVAKGARLTVLMYSRERGRLAQSPGLVGELDSYHSAKNAKSTLFGLFLVKNMHPW